MVKNLAPLKFVEELLYHGNGELILECLRVQGAIVDAEAPRPIWLAHQEDRGGERRGAGADDPLSKHVGALTFQLVLLCVRIAVRAHSDRVGAGHQANAVAVATLRW